MNVREFGRCTALRRDAERAFTLGEIMVATAIVMLVGATAMYALTSANTQAATSRTQAAAQSIVQNQIDQVLTRGPYVPTNSPPDIPAVLKPGTTTAEVPVFIDSETGAVAVNGTLSTVIQDSGATASGVPLYVLKASVTLNYKIKGKSHSVVMNTMRAPDQ